jgi:hypothetical protein
MNRQEFIDLDLVSRSFDIEELASLGTVLLTKGNGICLTVAGVMLMVELNDKNPFCYGDYLVYVDDDDLIWLGVITDED